MTGPATPGHGAPLHRAVDKHAELLRFGTRLRELRQRAGLRQEDLASLVGIDRVAISQIERGAREVGVSRVLPLAEALGVPPEDLFAPEGQRVGKRTDFPPLPAAGQ